MARFFLPWQVLSLTSSHSSLSITMSNADALPPLTPEERKNISVYLVRKIQEHIQSGHTNEAVLLLDQIFQTGNVTFEKHLEFHSGFEGESAELIPVQTVRENLEITDILRICDAIFCGDPDACENPEDFLETFSREYGSCRCSNAWQGNHMAYRCRTCGMSDSSCMCVECFDLAQHEGHDYRLYQSPSGGCCDCGDPLAWKPSGFCKKHQVPDENVDPTLVLDLHERHRFEVVVFCVMQNILRESEIVFAAEPCGQMVEFEKLYINSILWLKKIADNCDTFRRILNDFHLATRIPGMSNEKVSSIVAITTNNDFQESLCFEEPPLRRIFQVCYRMSEEAQTKTAMLHLGLLFSSRFKEIYTSFFVFEYPKFISMLMVSDVVDVAKGCAGFLDRIFCQLFHSPEQVLRVTQRANLVNGLLEFLSSMLAQCASQNVCPRTSHFSHATAGLPLKCVDTNSELLKSERHTRGRILTDLKTLVAHDIVAESLIHGDARSVRGFEGFLCTLREAQAMNSQKRETGGHILFESEAYKNSFMIELEQLLISRILSKVIRRKMPSCAPDSNLERQSIAAICTALDMLDKWLNKVHFTADHAISFFKRPCPVQISLHYPLHRAVAMLLKERMQRDFDERSSAGPALSIQELVTLHLGPDSSDNDAQGVALQFVEHPLLVLTVMNQINAGRWRRNGRSMLTQMLYYTSHYWHDMTHELDFFMLQVAASILSGDQLLTLLLSRFEISKGIFLSSSPFWHKNAIIFSLSKPQKSTWTKQLYNYFPGLQVGVHREDTPLSPEIPYFDVVQGTSEDWWVSMAEAFILLLTQVVSDRTVTGESRESTLRRSLIHRLAVQDLSFSQLQDKVAFGLVSKNEVVEQETFKKCLDAVSTFRAPVGSSVGMYTLLDECWLEVDITFLHWTKTDLQKVFTNYQSFYEFKNRHDPSFFEPQLRRASISYPHPKSPYCPPPKNVVPSLQDLFSPMQSLHKHIFSSRVLHRVIFGILFNTMVHAQDRTSNIMIICALRLLGMSLLSAHDEDASISVDEITLTFPEYVSDNIFVNFCSLIPLNPRLPTGSCGSHPRGFPYSGNSDRMRVPDDFHNAAEINCLFSKIGKAKASIDELSYSISNPDSDMLAPLFKKYEDFDGEGEPEEIKQAKQEALKNIAELKVQVKQLELTLDDFTGTLSMLQIVCFLLDSRDMLPYHSSLQHIVNVATGRNQTIKHEVEKLKARVWGADAGCNAADIEEDRLKNEAASRQKSIMKQFAAAQQAFLMEESDSGDDSSDDEDTSDEDKDENPTGSDTANANDDQDTDPREAQASSSGERRSRSASQATEGVCALCHDDFDDISKHGYPGMLAYVASTNILQQVGIQYHRQASQEIGKLGENAAPIAESTFSGIGESWWKISSESGVREDTKRNADESAQRSLSTQVLTCGHALHRNCYQEYVESIVERQRNNESFEGQSSVDADGGEFLCPICRRLCNIIIPLHHIGSKRQHLTKLTEVEMHTLDDLDVTLENMSAGWYDNANINEQTGLESSLEAKSMSSQIDSYSGQEKFLYEYASFLFERVENDPLNAGGEIPKSFCNWCSANDAIAVNSRRNVHEMSGKMIHFISTLLAEKIELCEVGSRSSRSFGAFDMISDKEGKTLRCFGDSLLLISELPHLREIRENLKKRVKNFIFRNQPDSLLLVGEEYKPLLLCGNTMLVFCKCIVSMGPRHVELFSKVLFLAHYMSCLLKARYCKLVCAFKKLSKLGDEDSGELAHVLKKSIERLNVMFCQTRKGDTSNPFRSMSSMLNIENLKMAKNEHLSDASFAEEILSEFLLYLPDAKHGTTLAALSTTLYSSLITGEAIDENVFFHSLHEHLSGEDCPLIESLVAESMTCDEMTRFFCLPFLRQMYIFRRFCLGDESIGNCQGATMETEYATLVKMLSLPSLGCFEVDSCTLSVAERTLGAVWVDQLRAYYHFNDSTHQNTAPLKLPIPVRLFPLPNHYTVLFMKHCFKSSLCHACGGEPQHPAMCLVCGFLVCCATKCGDGAAGGCTQHAEICGKGVSPFLFLKECALFFCMKNNRRCFYPTLYLDEHGEEDPSLKRGILLHLQEERWENLRQMYVHGNFEHMTQVLYRTSRGRRSLTY